MKRAKQYNKRILRASLASMVMAASLSSGAAAADESFLSLDQPSVHIASKFEMDANMVFKDPTVSDGSTEIINERYPDGTIRVRREVKQDKQGNYVRHGEWKSWDPQGNLVAEGTYKDGVRHGVWTRWYSSKEADLFSQSPYDKFQGPYVSTAEFDNGLLHGAWVIKDREQRKISEWEYVDGIRHGSSRWYHTNGNMLEEITFNEGEIDGHLKVWNSNGEPITEDVYQKGRKLAIKTEKYANGTKKTEGMYLHARYGLETADNWWDAKPGKFGRQGIDERHGPLTAWHPNGQKQYEGEFKHNLRVGEFTHWYTNGQKQAVGSYVEGKTHGSWTWWHENGQKSSEGHYVMGEPRGPWAFWKPDGQLAEKADFSTNAESSVVKSEEEQKPTETAAAPQSVLLR